MRWLLVFKKANQNAQGVKNEFLLTRQNNVQIFGKKVDKISICHNSEVRFNAQKQDDMGQFKLLPKLTAIIQLNYRSVVVGLNQIYPNCFCCHSSLCFS